MNKKLMCDDCNKETEHNHKFRLRNFFMVFALACNECGHMYYY